MLALFQVCRILKRLITRYLRNHFKAPHSHWHLSTTGKSSDSPAWLSTIKVHSPLTPLHTHHVPGRWTPFFLQDPSCLTSEPLLLLFPLPGHPFHLPNLWAPTTNYPSGSSPNTNSKPNSDHPPVEPPKLCRWHQVVSIKLYLVPQLLDTYTCPLREGHSNLKLSMIYL